MPFDNLPEKKRPNSGSDGLPKPQKTAVVILASLGILIFVFGLLQLRAQIFRPFNYQVDGDKTIASTTTTDYLDVLKNRDTDSDGLTDYEEIYNYKTSPYLEDTDSDGLTDKKEIASGTDPNCPQGQNCNVPTEIQIATSSGAIINQEFDSVAASSSVLNSAGLDEEQLRNILNGQINASALRQLMIQSGANKEDLDKISDEDLMNSYQETLKNQSQNQQ